MRAFFAVLLVACTVQAGDPGVHNGKILADLQLYENKDFVVKTPISAPDVVINKYTHLKKGDIKQQLKDHVQTAADTFAALANRDLPTADRQAMNMPSVLSPQIPFPSNPTVLANAKNQALTASATFHANNPQYTQNAPQPGPGKRSVPEMDYEATVELYRQARAFLDKYDVELRFD